MRERSSFDPPAGTNLDATNDVFHRIAAIAESGSGVVRRKDLLAADVSPVTITRMVERGYLRPLHRGVFAVGSDQLPHRGWLFAAVAAYGPSAVVSHRTAAAVWGIWKPERVIDISVTSGTSARRAGIRLHRDRRRHSDEITARGRIPVTRIEKTVRDLAESCSVDDLIDLVGEAMRRNLLRTERLIEISARHHGRRGSSTTAQLLRFLELDGGSYRSWLERRFRWLCERNKIPKYVTNAVVLGIEVDCLWEAERLIVELDGYAYHHDPAQFERDHRRDAQLKAAGYEVLRVSYRMLASEPQKVMAQLRALLRRRAVA